MEVAQTQSPAVPGPNVSGSPILSPMNNVTSPLSPPMQPYQNGVTANTANNINGVTNNGNFGTSNTSAPPQAVKALEALQKAIKTMEEKGMQNDPRYHQLLILQAQSQAVKTQPVPDPEVNKNMLNGPQMQQLRMQIMAYRVLARNQPLSNQLMLAVQGQTSSDTPGNTCSNGTDIATAAAPGPALQVVGVRATGPSSAVAIISATPAATPVASGSTSGSGVGQRPVAAGSVPATLPQQKQNLVTPLMKPAGLDPLIILQERENSFRRPLGIGVYGHPSHETSTYLLEVVFRYDDVFYEDDIEETFEIPFDNTYGVPAHDKVRNYDAQEEEDSFIWALIWSFIDILLEVLFL